MKQYETYEQARIDNPKSEICKLICEGFTTESEIARGNFGQYSFTYCKASDYCEMTLQEFLERGHLLVNGDVIITCLDNVAVMGVNDFEIANFNLNHESDSKTYILRAAALENQMNIDNLATQTPEEKEALDLIARSINRPLTPSDFGFVPDEDLIDTTPHQYEMSKFKSNPVIQLSIDEIDKFSGNKPRTKVEYEKWNFECAWHAIKAFEDGEKLYTKRSHKDFILIDNAQDVIRFLYSIYERIEYDETTQQREERERLEAAYDLYLAWLGDSNLEHAFPFVEWKGEPNWRNKWLRVLNLTNYRKESN
jgi:hypothetical protein